MKYHEHSNIITNVLEEFPFSAVEHYNDSTRRVPTSTAQSENTTTTRTLSRKYSKSSDFHCPIRKYHEHSEQCHESTRTISDFHCRIMKYHEHSNIVTTVLEEFRFLLPNHKISRALRTMSQKCSENFRLPLSNHEISQALEHNHESPRRGSISTAQS